jgi:hypothetical protein
MKVFLLTLLCIILDMNFAKADIQQGAVVWNESCDYFIADGPSGYYIFEWYGGYDPSPGDTIVGEIGSYGMKDVFYPSANQSGTVWVEDYLESEDGAWEEIRDHC